VNQQNGQNFEGSYGPKKNTIIDYFGVHGNLIYRSEVPASPGTATFSFFGIVYPDARIARVKIVAGDAAPGRNDGRKDIAVMDDFLYGEPHAIQH
jgi:hypothetical protein